MWESIKSFFTHNIEPFFTSFAESEVQALEPIAATQLTNLETGEIAALAAGGKDTGHVLAKVVSNTIAAAEIAGISAGASSVLVAVGNAAHKAGQVGGTQPAAS